MRGLRPLTLTCFPPVRDLYITSVSEQRNIRSDVSFRQSKTNSTKWGGHSNIIDTISGGRHWMHKDKQVKGLAHKDLSTFKVQIEGMHLHGRSLRPTMSQVTQRVRWRVWRGGQGVRYVPHAPPGFRIKHGMTGERKG
jgi:hypothetical protein